MSTGGFYEICCEDCLNVLLSKSVDTICTVMCFESSLHSLPSNASLASVPEGKSSLDEV